MGASRAAAQRLDALTPAAVAKASGGSTYRTVMGYLLGHAPPTVRAWFLDQLLDDTLSDNDFAGYAVTAIGTVDGALVRAAMPGYTWKVLHSGSADLTALHVLWLYGQYPALRAIRNSWRDSWRERYDQEDVDDFEASHPMPDLPADDQPGQPAEHNTDGAGPGRLPPGPPVIVRAAQVAEAARAWDQYESALRLFREAWTALRAAGPRPVLDLGAKPLGAGALSRRTPPNPLEGAGNSAVRARRCRPPVSG
jgi:hypothetical protein